MTDRFTLVAGPLLPERALAAFRRDVRGAGALVCFTGLVRDMTDGADVRGLFLQHYPGYTEKTICAFANEVTGRWDVIDWRICHRVGALAPGDPVVFVAAAAAHRSDAFAAVACLMDYLKTDAPFWKKERRTHGYHWIEPRDADLRARAQWKKKHSCME